MTTSPQPTEHTPIPRPPVKIAFVLDGRIIDVLHTDPGLAALLLSEPQIIDVTSWMSANPNIDPINAQYSEITGPTGKTLPTITPVKVEAVLTEAVPTQSDTVVTEPVRTP